MTDLVRQEVATAELVVVKVGTRVLTCADGTLDDARIAHLAEEIGRLGDAGRRVVLVSSGAVGAGMSQLGLRQRPLDLARLQAVAAIGQTQLIQRYDQTFHKHGRRAAQVLLTAGDFQDRSRYLNVRNTLLSLLELGAVPVINENDTVAVEELMATFGDNDRLAALVTNLLRAPLLIVLSDVAGLYDRSPDDPGARVIPTITAIDGQIEQLVSDRQSGVSKGGMASKLEAARIVTAAGENVIIASGREQGVLGQILDGQRIGSLFLAQGKSLSPWKRWIGFSAPPRGRLRVDDGAARAVVERGKSLLPIGILAVEGEFDKGDVVSVCSQDGQELARGLTNYCSRHASQIAGVQSRQIADILGVRPYAVVIHCDNLQPVADA